MIIEITGAGFKNKGAHLMLETVCQRLREAKPDVRLCMPLHHDVYYRDRAKYAIELTLRKPEFGRPTRRLAQDVICYMLGKSPLVHMVGLVPEHEIDGLIDISGYAFGDKWLVATTDRFTRRAASYKKRGKPVVMLPQMLGPFTKSGQAGAFQRLSRFVDLIYAREQESFEQAQPLVDQAVLRLAPDITIPTPSQSIPEQETGYACVVPNSRLCEQSHHQNWGDGYLPRLVVACRHLACRGLHIKIVQHEFHAADTRLVEALRQEIGSGACEVIQLSDPQILKGILGGAELVIGSRFHSLVSALSMSVPVIALGWAHKYDALLHDFGIPELIYLAENTEEELRDMIDSTLNSREVLVAALTERKTRLVDKVECMWTEVYGLFGIAKS